LFKGEAYRLTGYGMLLIISNQNDVTVDYLVPLLKRSGVSFLRFDSDCCCQKANVSYRNGEISLRYDLQNYSPDDFQSVWYRRPTTLHAENETPEEKFIVNELSEGFNNFFVMIPVERWINYPAHNSRASHKLDQLRVAQKIGLQIPETLITTNVDELRQFYEHFKGRVITKPLREGTVKRQGENDTLIYTNRVTEKHLEKIEEIQYCPTLFQECIEKKSDVRITIIDDWIEAVELTAVDDDGQQRCDIRRKNMTDVSYRRLEAIPQSVRTGLSNLMSYYSLRFGAIDMVVDKNDQWIFLEVNPNGQWAWLDQEGITTIGNHLINTFQKK
jgi:hypothetical protein